MIRKLIAALAVWLAIVPSVSSAQVGATRAYTTAEDWSPLRWLPGAEPLDLTNYASVWTDDFTTCDIGEDRAYRSTNIPAVVPQPGVHRWYATAETYGLAHFKYPSAAVSPYDCSGGILSITLSNPTGSEWQSGIMSADSSTHQGFTANYAYSYFEAKIKLPVPDAGIIPWPAWWFRGQNAPTRGQDTFTELDVIEPGLASSSDLTLQATTLHEWPGVNPRAGEITTERAVGYNINYTTFDNLWHTYGLLRTPKWWIVYRDGVEERRIRMVGREMQLPIYPILDLAMKFTPTAPTSTTYTMQVDYVHVYACQPTTASQTIACER